MIKTLALNVKVQKLPVVHFLFKALFKNLLVTTTKNGRRALVLLRGGGVLFKSVSSDEAFLVKVELVQMLGKVDRMEKLE